LRSRRESVFPDLVGEVRGCGEGRTVGGRGNPAGFIPVHGRGSVGVLKGRDVV